VCRGHASTMTYRTDMSTRLKSNNGPKQAGDTLAYAHTLFHRHSSLHRLRRRDDRRRVRDIGIVTAISCGVVAEECCSLHFRHQVEQQSVQGSPPDMRSSGQEQLDAEFPGYLDEESLERLPPLPLI